MRIHSTLFAASTLAMLACSDDDAPRVADEWPNPPPDGSLSVQDAGSDARGSETDPSAEDAAIHAEAAAPDAACQPGTDPLALDVTAIEAKGASGAPRKGESLELTISVENKAASAVEVTLSALLDSKRFSDYSAVPLASQKVLLCPGSNNVKLSGGPFLSKQTKQYALGSGAYEVARVSFEVEGKPALLDDNFSGKAFSIATSNALLVPVIYDAGYFTRIKGNPSTTPEAYLTASFARSNELFTPAGSDPDGAGNFKAFPGGFDELLNVRHLFRSFSTSRTEMRSHWD